uniref:Serpentine receptor class gamma n=1 Tax=Caenorhabditis tropicalis TaxID=1561998 RepID=A0A1I7TDL6_9PELO
MICDLTWAVLVLPMFFMPVIAAHSSGLLLWITRNPSIMVWLPFASLGGNPGTMSLTDRISVVIEDIKM